MRSIRRVPLDIDGDSFDDCSDTRRDNEQYLLVTMRG